MDCVRVEGSYDYVAFTAIGSPLKDIIKNEQKPKWVDSASKAGLWFLFSTVIISLNMSHFN